MIDHQSYCKLCAEKGIENPYKDEEHFNRAYGIVEPEYQPITITPKKSVVKQSLTTEKDHITDIGKKITPKKIKAVSTPQKPRQSQRKKPIMTDEEKKEQKKERQRGYYKKKVGREVKRRSAPMSLKHLTAEERRQHRLKKQKEYRERRKASGIKEVRTAEQKAQRNEYFKHYYERKKNDTEYMAKRAKTTAKYRERLSG